MTSNYLVSIVPANMIVDRLRMELTKTKTRKIPRMLLLVSILKKNYVISKSQTKMMINPMISTSCLLHGACFHHFFLLVCPKQIHHKRIFEKTIQTVRIGQVSSLNAELTFLNRIRIEKLRFLFCMLASV